MDTKIRSAIITIHNLHSLHETFEIVRNYHFSFTHQSGYYHDNLFTNISTFV